MRGLIEFGVRKPVVVSLLMWACILGGAWSGLTIRREFFPESNPEAALVSLSYPGASPAEVEEAMARKIEDAVVEIEQVERVRSNLVEGGGGISVELADGAEASERIEDIRLAIDSLQDLPDEAERIRVTDLKPNFPVIMLTVFGDVGEGTLKDTARLVKDDLRSLPGMGSISLSGTRRYEIRVDVDASQLVRHGLSLSAVSDLVKAWMAEVPGGTLRTPEANLGVRTVGIAERAEAIRRIPIRVTREGQSLALGDVATVSETFVDEQVTRRFNGAPSATLIVFKEGDEDAVSMAEMVRGYVAGVTGQPLDEGWWDRLKANTLGSDRRTGWDAGHAARARSPLPVSIMAHNDLARIIEGRLDLLTRNALQGFLLVLVVMVLFMNLRAAWWVMAGIAISIGITVLLMRFFGVTLNLISMFGLLIVIGMLADDAIVVSDNILDRWRGGRKADDAAIEGTSQVAWPVVATVMTTIVAFLPLGLLAGNIGILLSTLPKVAAIALGSSLIESLLILPQHIRGAMLGLERRGKSAIERRWEVFERWREERLIPAAQDVYARVATFCLDHRYQTSAAVVAVLVASLGMVAGGRVSFTFLPADDTETVIVDCRLPVGSPIGTTGAAAARIEAAARGQPEVRAISTILGQSTNFETGVAEAVSSHIAQIFIELLPTEDRDRDSSTVIQAIRDSLGTVDGVEELKFTEITGGPAGADITYEVQGEDPAAVRLAAGRIKEILGEFAGVYGIADDDYSTQKELKIELRPSAAAMGFTVAEVARQVRGSLFGLEAHVYSADREDIKVQVRLDERTRRRFDTVEGLWLVAPRGGGLVPLVEVASVREGNAYAVVRRVDRQRTVTVTADCGAGVNPEEITRAAFPRIEEAVAAIPGVRVQEAGRQKDLNESLSSLPVAMVAALAMIYVILAWLFSSYTQPIAVMLAIPFSVIGVVWGHWLLGYDLTFLSLIGFVALAGIVVNNSLIFVEFANERTRRGMGLEESLVDAGKRRLRPILLTTVTTVVGIAPLLAEQSFQARFLIPMGIAIAGGLASATILTLVQLPAILMIVDDLKRLAARAWGLAPAPAP
jgi:HAE1 family hydrophobic/amphiphilic exporter-1